MASFWFPVLVLFANLCMGLCAGLLYHSTYPADLYGAICAGFYGFGGFLLFEMFFLWLWHMQAVIHDELVNFSGVVWQKKFIHAVKGFADEWNLKVPTL